MIYTKWEIGIDLQLLELIEHENYKVDSLWGSFQQILLGRCLEIIFKVRNGYTIQNNLIKYIFEIINNTNHLAFRFFFLEKHKIQIIA